MFQRTYFPTKKFMIPFFLGWENKEKRTSKKSRNLLFLEKIWKKIKGKKKVLKEYFKF